ncbi:MAG: hypothetical protein PWP23_1792 [Candidatus Sumerlaeota bacterium]|nr:hypothetical protein [Candidatus Sumerlaeota bacterium]
MRPPISWLLAILLALSGGCSDGGDRRERLVSESRDAVARFDAPVLSVDELRRMEQQDDGILLVDTRADAEFAVSHLPGAIHWDPYENPEAVPEEVADALRAGRPAVFYCSIGYRSGHGADLAREALRARGTDVPATACLNLEGGIFEWAEQGGALEGGTLVHPYDARWGRLLRPDLRAPID